ncbi:MAG: hypothetical protein H7A55_22350 [Verrucomicrobiaceae bacterium]|nr:hypothetical protein [Verrucomicrobiaceae bacterium]
MIQIASIVGVLGCFALAVASAIRGCQAGHAPLAILEFAILSILIVEFWAVAPSELEGHLSHTAAVSVLWVVGLVPYLVILHRLSRRPS